MNSDLIKLKIESGKNKMWWSWSGFRVHEKLVERELF